MGYRVGISGEGCNLLDEQGPEPFDVDCYLMRPGGKEGPNTWKKQCELRYQMPENKGVCHPNCKYNASSMRFAPGERPNFKTVIERANIFLEESKAGLSHSAIAEKYGCSSSTVGKYIGMVKEDRVSYSTSITGEMIAEWKRLRTKRGWSHKQIADRYGYSKSTILKYIPEPRPLVVKKPLTAEDIKKIRLFTDLKDNKGMTFRRIAEEYNTTVWLVRKFVKLGREAR